MVRPSERFSMNYIVKVWLMNEQGKCTTNYYEIDELTKAILYAEERAKLAKDAGYDFDVLIYEVTSY